MEDFNNEIYEILEQLQDKLEEEVRRIAHEEVERNPEISYFMKGMGTYFFVDTQDEILHNFKLPDLENVISKWDSLGHTTGEPVQLHKKGIVIADG